MNDRQLDLSDDREMVSHQQVVVAMNASADRVLDRHDAITGRPAFDRRKHLLESSARDELCIGDNAPRRCLAEGPRLPLIGDSHGRLLTRSSTFPNLAPKRPKTKGPSPLRMMAPV